MSALPLALIMQLAANPDCTVPGMVKEFWAAVVRKESHYDPLALHDDTASRSYYPNTAEASEALATRLMGQGHSVGIGLSQLTASSPAQFERKFGIKTRAALDPCRNMRVGARFYVAAALSIYNSGTTTKGQTYAADVMADVRAVEAAPEPKQQVDPNDPQPPSWDMEAVADWRRRHLPTPEDAVEAPPWRARSSAEDPPAIAQPITKKETE